MTHQLEELTTREQGIVKIFTCGPSTYRRPHIGNYRTFLYEDVLVRFLTLKGYKVDRIINFTDLEDKTLEEELIQERKLQEITKDVASHFYKETTDLQIILPDDIPASSTSVSEAIDIIKKLIKEGYAYEFGGNVYFDPLTYPGFGRLFGLNMDEWPKSKKRFHRDTYNGNRWNRGDFILWHGDKGEHIHFWDSPFGRGRPSWNVQDPAMIIKHLGEQVDINCGGIDNIYRHHDYNIAIMEATTGKEYSRFYLHGEHLIVNGKTMSKSRLNILYPEDVYKMGFSPDELRFFLTAQKHYRSKLNFTEDSIRKSSIRLKKIRQDIQEILEKPENSENPEPDKIDKLIEGLNRDFIEAVDNDLSLFNGIKVLEKAIKAIKNESKALMAPQKGQFLDKIQAIDSVVCCLLN